MRKILSFALAVAGAFLFAPPARAQFTPVTAIVQDPNGIPYANGTMSAVLVPGTPGTYKLNGVAYSGTVGPVTLDGTGSFTNVNFGDLSLITPSGASWQITVHSNPGGVLPPSGTGSQVFSATIGASVITGSSLVNVSGFLDWNASNLTVVPSSSAPYVGVVATRTGFISKANQPADNSMMARNFHQMRLAPGMSATALQVVIGNFYDANSGEVNNGGTKTATCSIEYPAGTFNQCKFNGSTSVTITAGGQATSDIIPLQVAIPNGATFWERYFYTNLSGIDYMADADTNQDVCNYGVGVSDQTMGGTVSNVGGNVSTFMLAIVAPTTIPSVCLIGDSRMLGFRDAASNNSTPVTDMYIGDVAPSLSASFGFLQMGIIGAHIADFLSLTNTNRMAVSKYCTHVVDEYGVNDITSGVTAATALANQQSLAALFPGKPFFLTTLEPVSTSTDNWTTIANQTTNTNNTQLQLYNESVRGSAQLSWMTGFFDNAASVESSQGTGLWSVCTPASTAYCFTGDGTHENEVGYRAVRNLGASNATKIHR